MATAREAGIEALKNGNPKAALQQLVEAVKADPNDAQAHAYLGTAYGQLNMFDQAAACLTKAVALAPQSAALRYNLGMALERAGKRAEAVEAYRQSLAVDGGYDRARQALTRLGESVEPPAGGATPPAAAPPAPAAPVTPAAPVAPAVPGLGDFALGSDPAPAPVASTDVTLSYAAPGQEPTIATTSQWGAPSAPTLYGAPAAAPPQNPWAPTPGPQPMGDWTPPPSTGGGLADYQTAPQRPPSTASAYSPAAGAATMTTIEAPEQQMPRSWMLGHCYLSGMSLGVWWGGIAAVVFLLNVMLNFTSTKLAQMGGVVFVVTLMLVAVGALIYGVVGWIGGQTEEPERTCGNLGIGVGILASLFLMPLALSIMAVGVGGMFGTIFVSRLFGKSLGGRINEMQASVFVVSSSSGVAMVRGR